MSQPNKQYRVALSFPGEHRDFVARVANLLADRLGREHVLYDKFFEAQFARPNQDVILQTLYHDQSELVVVFLCSDYEIKLWPQLEWRAIRSLMATEDARIMFIRFDDTKVSGVFSNIDGFVEVGDREPAEIAALIMERVSSEFSVYSGVDLRAIRPFEGQVQRKALFQPFEDFARRRDIVFALGGVGSGLKTFLDQFDKFLEENQDHSFPSADFDTSVYQKIHEARTKQAEATADYRRSTDHDQFDLKCLLATMAYMTYHSLRQRFGPRIDNLVPSLCAGDPVHFAERYFSTSEDDAMFKAATGPIVEHFLQTVQRLAEATATDHIIVFMPWTKLARCFANHSDPVQQKLAFDLWDALGDFAANSSPRKENSADSSGSVLPERFDKVCLIVAGPEVPFGHTAFKNALVKKSLWPMPPLDGVEVAELLGTISPKLKDEKLADTLIDWSGGSPWYVRLVLSCVQHLSAMSDAVRPSFQDCELIEAACVTAEKILAAGPESVAGDLKRDFLAHACRLRDVLGDGEATDTVIEEAWAGPTAKRARGVPASPRVEAFVAAGLTWLDGDLWDRTSPQSIFRRYHMVYFRRAGRLPVADYQTATGRRLELAGVLNV